MSKLWNISFAISGTGYGSVVAETEEEAVKKARDGDWEEDPVCEEWDINSKPHQGGYLDAQED